MTEIARGWMPGAVGRITGMHAEWYAAHWGFGPFFEATVARGLAEFVTRYDPSRDGLWLAVDGGSIIGSVAVDGSESQGREGHLRWFIVDPARRGCGLGRRLLGEALDFCRAAGFERVWLSTFAGLDAARRLYEQAGFRMVEERHGTTWGTTVSEQRFELELGGRGA